MKIKHSTVTVRDLSGKVIKKLDVKESNKVISNKSCIYSDRYMNYMHRLVRSYTLS